MADEQDGFNGEDSTWGLPEASPDETSDEMDIIKSVFSSEGSSDETDGQVFSQDLFGAPAPAEENKEEDTPAEDSAEETPPAESSEDESVAEVAPVSDDEAEETDPGGTDDDEEEETAEMSPQGAVVEPFQAPPPDEDEEETESEDTVELDSDGKAE